MGPTAADLTNARILIVEDSPELAALYSAILRAHGADAVVACTMRDGLSKSFQIEPDLIFCDLSMAHGSGFDFIHAVRAMESGTGRHVLAAAVTGHCDAGSRATARDSGFDAWVAKPVTHELLVDTARRLLKHRRQPFEPLKSARSECHPPDQSSKNTGQSRRSPCGSS